MYHFHENPTGLTVAPCSCHSRASLLVDSLVGLMKIIVSLQFFWRAKIKEIELGKREERRAAGKARVSAFDIDH